MQTRTYLSIIILCLFAFAKAQINEVQKLDTVLVGKIQDPVKIIELVKLHLDTNLQNSYVSQKYAYIDREMFDFDVLDIDLDKATRLKRKEVKNVNDRIKKSISSLDGKLEMTHDLKRGVVYSFNNQFLKSNNDTLIQLGAEQSFDLDNPTSFLHKMIGKALVPEGRYSIHTGWFKIDDNLDHNLESVEDNDKRSSINSTQPLNRVSYQMNRIAFEEDNEFSRSFKWSFIENIDEYDYQLSEMPNEANDYCYIIEFTGNKSRSKFSGVLKVDSEDYGIHHLKFNYRKNKRGQHVNLKWLFGIKFSEDVLDKEISFMKDEKTSKYFITEVKSFIKSSVYVHRPIKIKRMDKREKIKFDIKFKGMLTQEAHATFEDYKQISQEDFLAILNKPLN